MVGDGIIHFIPYALHTWLFTFNRFAILCKKKPETAANFANNFRFPNSMKILFLARTYLVFIINRPFPDRQNN